MSCRIPLMCFLLAPMLSAQVAPSNLSPQGQTLITVSVRPKHSQIRRGHELGVEITLTAGHDGAYLPNFFGDFDKTCEKGFWADIVTAEGKRASEMNHSCASEELFGNTSARELLDRRYVFLNPGEKRRWHTVLPGITKAPGLYSVQAGYISSRDQIRIQEIAALPEVRGLMVLGRVDAKSVTIRIRQR